jgi:hypothetical protein
MKILKKKIFYSIILSLILLSFIYLFEYLLGFNFSFPLFKIASMLEIPGMIVINVILSLIIPTKAWQIMHGVGPSFLIYLYFIINFVFYFIFFVFVLKLFNKSKKIQMKNQKNEL